MSAQAPAKLIVDGRLLTGPFSATEDRGGRLFVPVVTIAEALGDSVSVQPFDQLISIRRANGVLAEFDVTAGQIRENGAVTLLATNAGEIAFPPNVRALLLPSEIASSLLDAAIVIDTESNSVRVTRDLPQVMLGVSGSRGLAQLHTAKYAYTFNGSQTGYFQVLQTLADGRLHDGRFDLNANFRGVSSGPFAEFQTGRAVYERPGGQRFMFGDLALGGGDMRFLNTGMRGAMWRQPVSAVEFTTFGGMAISGFGQDEQWANVPSQFRFDTPVVGGYFTLGRSQTERSRLLSSTGGLYFKGPTREGGLASTALRYETDVHQFRVDLGVGSFEGEGLDGARIKGLGLLLEAVESLTPIPELTLTAGFTHIGENYLNPQSGALARPLNEYAGGGSWQPATFISFSGGARLRERLDRADRAHDQDFAGTVSLRPGDAWPTLMLSHGEGTQAEIGLRSFTLLNIIKNWSSVEGFVNLARSRLGEFESNSVTVGGRKRFDNWSLRAFQTVSQEDSLSGGVDFATSSFLTDRLRVNAGVGYSRIAGDWLPIARAGISAQLPWSQILTVNYIQSRSGTQAFLELRGPLFDSPRAAAAGAKSVQAMQDLVDVTGRVYQDIDLDGRFTPGVDKPLRNVEVRLDSINSIRTDAEGRYELLNLDAGTRSLYLNLLTVRADLSMLTSSQQQLTLEPGKHTRVDFRLVRTGRASGLVWFDANGNGEPDEDEQPLGDVRVVTGNRDTLTNGDGEFLLGDLPQGQHSVLIDEKTLPDGLKAARSATLVTVTPPVETNGVLLPVVERPPEVEIKEF